MRDRVIEALCACSPCTLQSLAEKLPDVHITELRRVISELLREGVVSKEPDYEHRKLVYKVDPRVCVGEALKESDGGV